MTGNLVRIAATAAMVCSLAVPPAWSRQWKATPEALAREYATINDTRPGGDLVLLIWFVPQMVRSDTAGGASMTSMLHKNVILVVVHGHLDKATGLMSYEDVNALEAKDQNGRALTPIARDGLSPMAIGAVTMVETMFRQSLGVMGKGMKLFVFDAGSVESCGKGQLSVAVANETYTWDTPIPGCQSH